MDILLRKYTTKIVTAKAAITTNIALSDTSASITMRILPTISSSPMVLILEALPITASTR